MIAKLSLTCILLASSAAALAQEAVPPTESPSEAASQHAPPQAPAGDAGDKA